MLKCSTSLWSADLANLAMDIRRVAPYSERFHLDVADGHYVHELLFFPDLVRAIRSSTDLPFEVHLMTVDPLAWIEPFIDAGADRVIFCFDSVADPAPVLHALQQRNIPAGISLQVTETLDAIRPHLAALDTLTLVGTPMGTKGTSMDTGIPDKVRAARRLIAELGLECEIEVDGGIRRNTVPLLHDAGADFIVPGSLMFKEEPREMRQWLAGL